MSEVTCIQQCSIKQERLLRPRLLSEDGITNTMTQNILINIYLSLQDGHKNALGRSPTEVRKYYLFAW